MAAEALVPSSADEAVELFGDGVAEVRVPGPIPLDVDTREDYEAVLAAAAT